ncbi:MAG: hypothetical protein CVV44_15690 [Spirochaetae bacterium HGW-Spirochaetae-1]|jgi:hypothetical protein|nr:MAG: hypothetical protein CVV44_15690 [Spirochaetae bacterium HGW-Spirochaetae-1]
MEKLKKILQSRIFQAAIIILVLFIIAVICTITQSRTCLVKNSESQYYRARSLFIMGNTLVCRKGTSEYNKREEALSGETGFTLTLVNLKDIALIEFMPDEEQAEEAGPVPTRFLGSYNIIVAAHQGFLYLWSKDGRAYGSIRFPHWGRGVAEPLKGVYISSSGNIRFTRSVTTRAEQSRVGSSTYFTQGYYGKYYKNGNFIKGFYTREGHRGLWEAVRKK